jgi:hypothetical protein
LQMRHAYRSYPRVGHELTGPQRVLPADDGRNWGKRAVREVS